MWWGRDRRGGNYCSQRIPNLTVSQSRKKINTSQIRVSPGRRELKPRATGVLLMLILRKDFLEEVMIFRHGVCSISLYINGRQGRNARQK